MNRRLVYAGAFAVLLGLAFRTFSDLHDGLSWRNVLVSWWSWHVVGWLGREIWQGALVIYVSICALKREQIIGKDAVIYLAVNLAASAVLSYFWHNFVYDWTLRNLKYFDW